LPAGRTAAGAAGQGEAATWTGEGGGRAGAQGGEDMVRRVVKTREEPCSRGADDGHTHGRSQGSALGRTETPTRRRGRPGRGGGG
jgi:hypothetical protein